MLDAADSNNTNREPIRVTAVAIQDSSRRSADARHQARESVSRGDEPYLTPEALAERWSCTKGWLANMRSAGVGPRYLKIGRSVRYRVADIRAFEAANTVEPVWERTLAHFSPKKA